MVLHDKKDFCGFDICFLSTWCWSQKLSSLFGTSEAYESPFEIPDFGFLQAQWQNSGRFCRWKIWHERFRELEGWRIDSNIYFSDSCEYGFTTHEWHTHWLTTKAVRFGKIASKTTCYLSHILALDIDQIMENLFTYASIW